MSTANINPNALYRARDIVRTKDGPGLLGIARRTWWAGVKSGRFPKPVRDGGMTFWTGADLLALVQRIVSEGREAQNKEDPAECPARG